MGNYVVCSGVSRTVRSLVETAFGLVGLDHEPYVLVDPELVRPADPVPLVGDPSKAHAVLGWRPRTTFDEMIEMMVEADTRDLSREQRTSA
ncbi:MAG: GDP-mannose 4,6-dehydratase [Solirubrobacteraceae bacterium]